MSTTDRLNSDQISTALFCYRLGIKFRQLTDGKHFIQLIYDENGRISDCEYLHEKESVSSFTDTFRRDVHLLTTLYNATVVDFEDNKIPSDLGQWMNYQHLKQQCRRKHKQMKKLLEINERKRQEMQAEMNIR